MPLIGEREGPEYAREIIGRYATDSDQEDYEFPRVVDIYSRRRLQEESVSPEPS